MGIFSEVSYGLPAKRLETALLSSLEKDDVAVFKFCKKEIYPLYKVCCEEACMEEHKSIKHSYGEE